jgi:DNA-binding XRE family transcriptional regulator
MVRVMIVNRISEKIDEFQEKYGSSRTFVAKKAGISRQNLYILEKSDNPTIQSLVKIAYVLGCKTEDLYISKVVEDDE